MPLLLFFFNDPAPTELYTLSLHDALPIWPSRARPECPSSRSPAPSSSRCSSAWARRGCATCSRRRSEEHTSELQSRRELVCRLLLAKKKKDARPQVYGSCVLSILAEAP